VEALFERILDRILIGVGYPTGSCLKKRAFLIGGVKRKPLFFDRILIGVSAIFLIFGFLEHPDKGRW